IPSVAKTLREKFPRTTIVICADDDYRTAGNPGLTKANEAAAQIRAKVVVPEFGSDRPEKATDFNDMAAQFGLNKVTEFLCTTAVPKAEPKQDCDEDLRAKVVALAGLGELATKGAASRKRNRSGFRLLRWIS